MYNAFYGFREKPFKLVPNPDYLYLSKSHEIALAHLTYATGQGDGFVVITGEVGTGKTTLCRIFLERLDDQTESAYVFNPKLDSVELLTTICNEFGIRTNMTTVKGLLDVINGYLIMKNKSGRKVILLIDEAQNLTIENLEMVRMLSNLETTRSKLLQIILVGQPELSDKLDSYELRQLSQRISMSCHLNPLTAKETEGYIQHRINIAAQRDLSVFTSAACRKIHLYAKGIPRLINIACDRALLSAYSLDRKKVTTPIAQTAIREMSSRGHIDPQQSFLQKMIWGLLALIVILAAVFFIFKSNLIGKRNLDSSKRSVHGDITNAKKSYENDSAENRSFKVPLPIPASPAETKEIKTDIRDNLNDRPVAEDQRLSVVDAIEKLEPRQSRLDAIGTLLSMWQQPKPNAGQLPQVIKDDGYFDIAARQYGLRIYKLDQGEDGQQLNWELIKRLNMPCIVAFKHDRYAQPVYLALIRWLDGRVSLSGNKGSINVAPEVLQPYLQGNVYLFWKNTTGFDAIIANGAKSEAVLAVKSLLQQVGYGPFNEGPMYDPLTRQAVLQFQSKHQLEPDGLVGPLTKILLINEAKAYNVPHLNSNEERGA